jgi:hypothetical protein
MPNKGLKPRLFMHVREDLKHSESNSAFVIPCSILGHKRSQGVGKNGKNGKDIRQVRGHNSMNVVGFSNRKHSSDHAPPRYKQQG